MVDMSVEWSRPVCLMVYRVKSVLFIGLYHFVYWSTDPFFYLLFYKKHLLVYSHKVAKNPNNFNIDTAL